MSVPIVREVRLTAFKSYRDATLPIDAITVLTGRNSSGKSNALDGIEVLSRLASGEDLADALDGRRRENGPVRGGSRGCAPHGTQEFTLGCTVAIDGASYDLDVSIQVEPYLRIVRESLRGPAPALASGQVDIRPLIQTRELAPNSTAIVAEIFNGKRGGNPPMDFRDSRLITAQLPLRMTPKNRADEAVIAAADAVTTALRGVFHLDPVPHLMREYVAERDAELRRTGENISAALNRLRNDDPEAFNQLTQLVNQVADYRVSDLTVERSSLGDVMLALREASTGEGTETTSAKEMSDGLLRFIAIGTALLTPNKGLDIDPGLSLSGPSNGVLLVIEELENGLHPSQAGRVLELIKSASKDLEKQVLVTTHSPALLNAMTGQLNRSVIVCYRDTGSGQSKLSRLTELPGYAEAMASGRLGDAVTRGQLTQPEIHSEDYEEFNRLLGIDLPA